MTLEEILKNIEESRKHPAYNKPDDPFSALRTQAKFNNIDWIIESVVKRIQELANQSRPDPHKDIFGNPIGEKK